MTSQLHRALFTAKDVEVDQASVLRVSYTTIRYFSVKGNTLDDEF